ncbi:MAG: hypothetical protein Q8J65_02575 [Nitrosomonadales bacterium]|nr:hypothetical protein [Nitrosomonadales bacterium]
MSDRKQVGVYQLQTSAGTYDQGRQSTISKEPSRPQLETYGDHARQSGMATRQRVGLILQGFRERIHQSRKDSRVIASSAIREAGAQLGFRVSRRLHRLADRIERKAEAIRRR